MNLKEYLFRKDISQVEFAEKLGVTRETVSRIVKQRNNPSPKLAKKIEELTNGEVTAMELLFPDQNQ